MLSNQLFITKKYLIMKIAYQHTRAYLGLLQQSFIYSYIVTYAPDFV